MKDILQLVKIFKANETIFMFGGYFSKELVELAVQNIRGYRSDSLRLNKRLKFSVNVLVEMMENIINYSTTDEFGKMNRFGIILLAKENESLYVLSSNPVSNSRAEALKKKIEFINSLDKECLLQEFREARRKKRDPSKLVGAGLGFFEMAKISHEKLQIDFLPCNQNSKYFNLTVMIP